jgi:hypothetical protein
MIERAPFASVTDALYYLFNPERATVDRPPASRLADKRRGDPGALSGEDGTATAARASAMLESRLTPLQLAILACRYAPSRVRCECRSICCSGKKTNVQWSESIDYVAHEAVYSASPRGEGLNVRFARAVLEREYGKKKVSLIDFGGDLGMASGTCTGHKRRIMEWLLHQPGDRALGDQEGKRPKGQEVVALDAAEEVLKGGGFIEKS